MLLFFDIDGTLIDDSGRLPASVGSAMDRAHRNGHGLIINTGRTLCNLDHRLDALPLDGWIMGCGTRVLYRGETLQSMEYDPEPSLRLRALFLELWLPVVYECDTGMYFDPLSPPHPYVDKFREFSERNGLAREVNAEDPEFRIVKMFCFTADEKVLEALMRRTAELGMPYTAIDRGNTGWEVVPVGYTKATGIECLRKKLGVALADCYAFGDSRNDLSMLRHVPNSIAMGNASEDVKAACAWVTARPEEDGIEKAMEHFGLI